ncbi:MAG: hypothetical protein KGY74_09160 [Candidatus Cloacimonetes bacterium]|nr:hypothetical protein [Candidatus Cloacimonadota bacterium]
MKRKIISFVGLLLFVGVVAFNMQMVNSNNQSNKIKLKNVKALATSVACYWYCDNMYGGDTYFIDCYGCLPNYGDELRYPDACQ